MSLEIEKKYRLKSDDVERVKKTLDEIGAEFVRSEFEENTIFTSDALRETGGVIRVRKTDRCVLLTYKRRVESEFDVKTQIEHEVEVSDAEIAESILAELGMQTSLVYEKRRDTWKLKSVEVVLDELPFGRFMEIEGPVTGINEAELLLAIDGLEVEHETYPSLTARLGRKVDGISEARFS